MPDIPINTFTGLMVNQWQFGVWFPFALTCQLEEPGIQLLTFWLVEGWLALAPELQPPTSITFPIESQASWASLWLKLLPSMPQRWNLFQSHLDLFLFRFWYKSRINWTCSALFYKPPLWKRFCFFIHLLRFLLEFVTRLCLLQMWYLHYSSVQPGLLDGLGSKLCSVIEAGSPWGSALIASKVYLPLSLAPLPGRVCLTPACLLCVVP